MLNKRREIVKKQEARISIEEKKKQAWVVTMSFCLIGKFIFLIFQLDEKNIHNILCM